MAQRRLSEAESERTEEIVKEEMLILLSMKQVDSLNHRLELYQANQWADQAQTEKSWLFGEF